MESKLAVGVIGLVAVEERAYIKLPSGWKEIEVRLIKKYMYVVASSVLRGVKTMTKNLIFGIHIFISAWIISFKVSG